MGLMYHAIILAGGSGHRLWPASLRARPKQFLPLGRGSGESLLFATWRRLSPVCGPAGITVVTAAEQVDAVHGELPALTESEIVAEPMARNTAAALGLAAVYLCHRDSDAVLGALPADHHIDDEEGFARVVERAFAVAAAKDVIVTIGIAPTRAEVGFGYLHVGPSAAGTVSGSHRGPGDGDVVDGGGGSDAFRPRPVARFVEKPDAETAATYVASGQYLWNAGMFFVRARRLLDDIARYQPQLSAGLEEIAEALRRGGPAEAQNVAAAVYPGLPSISIDHGVMERVSVDRAGSVVALPGRFGWNDVGSWAALADYRHPDSDGNITAGQVVACDAEGNIAIGEDGHVIALVGVRDLVVVQSGNRILVVPKARAQEVRAAVKAMNERGLAQYL